MRSMLLKRLSQSWSGPKEPALGKELDSSPCSSKVASVTFAVKPAESADGDVLGEGKSILMLSRKGTIASEKKKDLASGQKDSKAFLRSLLPFSRHRQQQPLRYSIVELYQIREQMPDSTLGRQVLSDETMKLIDPSPEYSSMRQVRSSIKSVLLTEPRSNPCDGSKTPYSPAALNPLGQHATKDSGRFARPISEATEFYKIKEKGDARTRFGRNNRDFIFSIDQFGNTRVNGDESGGRMRLERSSATRMEDCGLFDDLLSDVMPRSRLQPDMGAFGRLPDTLSERLGCDEVSSSALAPNPEPTISVENQSSLGQGPSDLATKSPLNGEDPSSAADSIGFDVTLGTQLKSIRPLIQPRKLNPHLVPQPPALDSEKIGSRSDEATMLDLRLLQNGLISTEGSKLPVLAALLAKPVDSAVLESEATLKQLHREFGLLLKSVHQSRGQGSQDILGLLHCFPALKRSLPQPTIDWINRFIHPMDSEREKNP